MLKCFYRTIKKEKLFYESKLAMRSSAYGQKVLEEYSEWKKFTDQKCAFSDGKFRMLSSGDVGNNTVIGQKRDVRYVHSCNVAEERLPGLSINGSVLDIDSNGYIRYDNDRVLYPGGAVSAWGIVCLPREPMAKYYLAVITSENDKCALTVYSIETSVKVNLRVIATTVLPYSYASGSFIVCLGRNIFVIHDGKLGYYYFVPEKQRIETVQIGRGEFNIENGELVSEPLIATDGGYIFWIAGNNVCGFRLGSPSRIRRFGSKPGFDITSLQSYHDVLYVYYRSHKGVETMCYTYSVSGAETLRCELFNEKAIFNLILEDNERQLLYIKVSDRNVELMRRHKDRAREETLRSFTVDKTSNKVSLADSELYVGSLNAGFAI